MRKTLLALLAATAMCFSFTSCTAGPHQLMRTVDDWDHKMYVSSPWLNAILWVVPMWPILHVGARIGDFFVTDAYAFWFKDAWDGKGTGFKHYDVAPTDGQMHSLMIDGAKYLEIK